MEPDPGPRAELFWKTDSRFRLIHVEGAAADIFGLPPQELIGKTLWDLAGADREAPKWREHRRNHTLLRAYGSLELSFVNAAHQPKWISVSGRPCFGNTGSLHGYAGSLVDVTATHWPASDVASRLARGEAIKSINRLAISGVPERELFESAAASIADALGATLVCIARSADGGELVPAAFHGLPFGFLPDETVPLQRFHPFRKALRTGEVVQFAPGEADFLIEGSGTERAGLAISVDAAEGQPGLICAYFEQMPSREADIEFLRVIASVFASARAHNRSGKRLRMWERALAEVDRGVHISEMDPAGDYAHFVNQAFVKMTGYSAEEMRSLTPDLPFEPESMQGPDGGGGPDAARLVRIRRRDGEERWLDLSTSTINGRDADEPYRIRVLSDATERLDLLERLHSVEKDRLIGQLAGGVAHDFNNLLTVVTGNAEILAEEHDAPQLKASAELILESAQRCAAMVRRLIEFARNRKLKPETFVLSDAIGALSGFIERVVGPDIAVRVDARGGSKVLADRGLLESALLNLAVNARDAMAKGGELSIESGVLGGESVAGIAPSQVGRYIQIVVRDTGHGMSEETRARILEPFFTTKQHDRGTGLGLPLVQTFARQFGGRLAIQSTPGEGTTVRLFLRRAAPRLDRKGHPHMLPEANHPEEA